MSAFRKHTFKCVQIRPLIGRIPAKLKLPSGAASQRTANAADPMKAALIQRIDRDTFGTNVVPHIAVHPVHDWIADTFRLQSTILKQPPCIIIIVANRDSAAYVGGLFFVNTAVLAALGAFGPTDTCCYHATFAALLFENRTAVSYNARRRHEFLRYQIPHCHASTLVRWQVDGTLDTLVFQPMKSFAHMVNRFGSIYRGMIMLYFVPDTGRPCQRKTHIAVLAARCGNDQRCVVIGFTHFRSQPQTSDCLLFLIHCAP